MHISYSNLWKLLAEKKLSKSDLAALTGLSSRVISKLGKNETVTTDTIAKICAALSCDVADIMEYSSEESLSLYQCFRTKGELVDESDEVKKIRFPYQDKAYTVYITKKAATKASHVYCEQDGALYLEQLYPMGGYVTPQIERSILVKPKREANEIVFVVLRGKPGVIVGLDEGIWVSAKAGRLKTGRDIFVMSEAVFKLFLPKE